VMICHTIAAQVGAIEEVVAAVKKREISQFTIQASVDRVKKLKAKYLSDTKPLPTSTGANSADRNSRQESLATEIYAQSTTVVRSEPGSIPIFSDASKKIVFVSPGKTPVGSGAVESGEEKTREQYTPASYIDVVRVHNQTVVDIRFHDGVPFPAEEQKQIDEADIIIFATRNASLSPYQKELGISLGKNFGNKITVIATCDPYDFLEEKEEIKNYITIYEPTTPAFRSAIDIVFGITKPRGTLPVSSVLPKYDIRVLGSSDEETGRLWNMWQEIFPKWKIDRQRLTKFLRQTHGHHLIHENGFCISFLMPGGHGKTSAVGVLSDYRGSGLGTALIRKAQQELIIAARSSSEGGLKSLDIGSASPRFWPQVPIDLSQTDKDFFLHRGNFIPEYGMLCTSNILQAFERSPHQHPAIYTET